MQNFSLKVFKREKVLDAVNEWNIIELVRMKNLPSFGATELVHIVGLTKISVLRLLHVCMHGGMHA